MFESNVVYRLKEEIMATVKTWFTVANYWLNSRLGVRAKFHFWRALPWFYSLSPAPIIAVGRMCYS